VVAEVPVKSTSSPTKCRRCRVSRALKTRESINKVSVCVQKFVPHFTRWRSRSRHCATSPKDAVSIADGVHGALIDNISGHTLVLGSTQPLKETSKMLYLLGWGVVRAAGA